MCSSCQSARQTACASVLPVRLSVLLSPACKCSTFCVWVCLCVCVCFAVCGWICGPKRSRESASNCGPHQMWQQLPPLQCSTTLKIEQIAHIMMRANGISGRLPYLRTPNFPPFRFTCPRECFADKVCHE